MNGQSRRGGGSAELARELLAAVRDGGHAAAAERPQRPSGAAQDALGLGCGGPHCAHRVAGVCVCVCGWLMLNFAVFFYGSLMRFDCFVYYFNVCFVF